MIRFGSDDYFKELDRQVNAMLAPQLTAGIMTQEHANELRAEAQRKAHKKVMRFYGMPQPHSSGHRKETGRVALPVRVVTDPAEQAALAKTRANRKKRARRKVH